MHSWVFPGSSVLDVLKHHRGELVVRNLAVTVLINLLNNLLNDLLVKVLSERQDLLDLVG